MTHLERQLRLLAQGGVDFIVIGGMAAAAHGSVRATLDLDVVYSRDLENVRRLVTALALLRLKRAAGRPKDLEAIAELELIRDRTPE
jgi:hypothetical protein